jgi:hypothetical protein
VTARIDRADLEAAFDRIVRYTRALDPNDEPLTMKLDRRVDEEGRRVWSIKAGTFTVRLGYTERDANTSLRAIEDMLDLLSEL